MCHSIMRGSVKTAEKLYRRAVVVNPRVAEAQLRHGRVLEKLERYEEAVGPLERVVELGESGLFDYLAHLVLGGIEERMGRVAKAIDHYRVATEVFPDWQVAHIALAHALHVSGQRKASRSALSRSVDAPPASVEALMGWWSYELGRSEKLEPLLEHLRERVYF
jgi:tetratricopeptide (TPR) repeat protein